MSEIQALWLSSSETMLCWDVSGARTARASGLGLCRGAGLKIRGARSGLSNLVSKGYGLEFSGLEF